MEEDHVLRNYSYFCWKEILKKISVWMILNIFNNLSAINWFQAKTLILHIFCRKIRHPNIINLMAIAFEPFRRLALILEPTKYTLHHHLFAKVCMSVIRLFVVLYSKVSKLHYHELNRRIPDESNQFLALFLSTSTWHWPKWWPWWRTLPELWHICRKMINAIRTFHRMPFWWAMISAK